MRFYTVSDDYIRYLQQFDTKVPNNGGAGYKGSKIYVGVVLEIGNHRFLAPLTSYKPSQDRIQSSSCTAFKLHERTNPDNKLGMIALSYMLPVLESELVELDISAQPAKYQQMLQRQYDFIRPNQQEIMSRATKLHEHVVIKRSEFFVRVSCDISKLVDEYRNYQKNR